MICSADTTCEAFGRAFVRDTLGKIVAAAEDRAERDKATGRWDGLKQLRLDGLRSVCAETEDISIPHLADLMFSNGLEAKIRMTDAALAAGDGPDAPAAP